MNVEYVNTGPSGLLHDVLTFSFNYICNLISLNILAIKLSIIIGLSFILGINLKNQGYMKNDMMKVQYAAIS